LAAVSRPSSHLGCLSLVVAGGVEDEFAHEVAAVGDDPDVELVYEHEDFGSGPGASDADVVEAAVVSQGEVSATVDAVFADSELFVDVMPCRVGWLSAIPSAVSHGRTSPSRGHGSGQ